MKKDAFTLLELVFVIVVISVLATTFTPRFDRDNLQEAANQVVSHIRYTQHLAMMDDKYVSNKDVSKYSDLTKATKEARYWHKGRWQIYFFNVASETPSHSFAAYTIFSDSPSSSTLHSDQYDGNPNESSGYKEVAKNPMDTNRYLIGTTHASFTVGEEHITKSLNLYTTYGINEVKFLNGCSAAHRIAFDNIGRPIQGDLKTSDYPYQSNRIVKERCEIVLCLNKPCDDNNITIAVEPETGYAHIL